MIKIEKIMTEKKSVNTNNLTEGPIWKKMLLYFIPIAVGTLLQQLYNSVDAIIVGRFVGTEALAAVGGSAAMMTSLVIGIFVALASGASVVIAQRFGARDEEHTSASVGTAVASFCIMGIVLTVIMIFCSEPILHVMNTPDETIAQAAIYCRIYFSGSIFMIMFNIGSGILRAVGNSRKPLIYLIVSCLSNISLDLVFVVAFGWGVVGVALATIIAQGISCILIMTDLIRTNEIYRLSRRNLKINTGILKSMMKIGIPTCVQSSMYGISNLILTVAVNGLGTVVVASWSMSGKIDGVYWAISEAFGVAIMNFVAQNFGAGQRDRIKQGAKLGIGVFVIITIVVSGIILIFAQALLRIFTPDVAVQETTWKIITYFVPFYIVWSTIEAISSILRGVGDTLVPAIILAVGICGVRIAWVFTVFQIYHTLFIVSMSYGLSWFVTDVALIIYFIKNRRKLDSKAV